MEQNNSEQAVISENTKPNTEKDGFRFEINSTGESHWALSVNESSGVYHFKSDKLECTFNQFSRILHQGGTGNYCEDSFFLEGDEYNASILLRSDLCSPGQSESNTANIYLNFSAVIVIYDSEKTYALSGTTQLDKEVYLNYYAEGLDEMRGNLGNSSGSANDFDQLEIESYQNNYLSNNQLHDFKAWGMEPGWELWAKQDSAHLVFFHDGTRHFKMTKEVTWLFQKKACVDVYRFNTNTTNAILIYIDHTNPECGCEYKDINSTCGCNLDQAGYGPFSAYLHLKSPKENTALLGCGVIYRGN